MHNTVAIKNHTEWCRDPSPEVRSCKNKVTLNPDSKKYWLKIILGNQDPGSWIQDPGSRILDPESWIQDPRSRIQGPGSRIQEPGSGTGTNAGPGSGSVVGSGTGSGERANQPYGWGELGGCLKGCSEVGVSWGSSFEVPRRLFGSIVSSLPFMDHMRGRFVFLVYLPQRR